MVGAGETCLGMRNHCRCGGVCDEERGKREEFMTVSGNVSYRYEYHSTIPHQCVKTLRLLHPYFGHLSCVYKINFKGCFQFEPKLKRSFPLC